MAELLLNLRKPMLVEHQFFGLLEHPRIPHTSTLLRNLCSEGLVYHLHQRENTVFLGGSLAHAMTFTSTGTYQLTGVGTSQRHEEEAEHFNVMTWFAEVCLYTQHIHTSTLEATSDFAEAFT